MATTSPDNIWTPDSGDDYALTVDLAAMADSVQDALNANKTYRIGTDAERLALSGADLFDGLRWDSTDLDVTWIYRGGWGIESGPLGILRSDSAQSIPSGGTAGGTILTFPVGKLAGGFTSSSNGLVVPHSGTYEVSTLVRYASSTTGRRDNSIRVNGDLVSSMDARTTPSANVPFNMYTTGVLDLSPGDLVQLGAGHTEGSSLDVTSRMLLVKWLMP